jgi:xyloglucan-specific exo-beta-1,4-glucanase
MKRMKCDARAVFAALALVLASCQGSGLDSGMGGDMTPPVSQPGAMNAGGINSGGPGGLNGGMNGGMSGPSVGMNGQEQLANPGATLGPNEAQYPISQGPTGMKCPNVQLFSQQYTCNLAFNMASPSPGSSPKPTASPTPSPSPTASSDDSDDDDDSPSPSPTPGGTITLQTEPLPKDVPSMVNPNPLFLRVTPLMAIRLQSNLDFALGGGTSLQYTLPALQFSGRVFALQLFNETTVRGKRTDQIIGNYAKWTSPNNNVVQFTFNVPQVTVRHTQVWLVALYGAQLPPGSTPTPSPSPSPTTSPSSSP